MTNRLSRLTETILTPEDAEEGIGEFEQPFRRMRTPLLQSSSADDDSNNSGLRHRPSTAISDSALVNFDDDDLENQEEHRGEEFHPQQQRILDRSGMFRQSRGRWGVERRLSTTPEEERRASGIQRCCCSYPYCYYRRIYQEWGRDWFFWLAYKKTSVLFLLLFLSYALIICFFGFVYLTLSIFGSKAEVNPDGSTKTIAFCDMDINDHMEAMYFSLSTMTTIGYGVSDYYFGGCYSPLLLVLLQICTAIVFDAVAVGLIFHRISRGAKRSRSILFSDKAIVRNIRGVPHLMFRLGERRKHHLIEATVRCYCVRHERIPNYPIHSTNDMNDEQSNNLAKREQTLDRDNNIPDCIETTSFVSRQMRLLQPDDRFGSHLWMGLPQVVVHRIDENSPLLPSAPVWFDAGAGPHRYPPHPPNISSYSKANSRCIQDFMYDRDIELVVLVNGTDEGTGAATQARHSFKLCDIAWNYKFADCVHPYSRRQRSGPSSLDPVVSIDFSKFHDIVPAPEDCDACAYVQD